MNGSFWCRWCGSRLLPMRDPACIICGGNVARAERLKLALGTRARYFPAAARVGGSRLSGRMSMRIGLILRFRQHLGTPAPKPLLDAVCDEMGYCLDAPEEMPGGSVVWTPVPEAAWPWEDPEDSGFPAQRVVHREPEAADPGFMAVVAAHGAATALLAFSPGETGGQDGPGRA